MTNTMIVSQFMTPIDKLITAEEDVTLDEVTSLLLERHIGCIVIVSSSSSKKTTTISSNNEIPEHGNSNTGSETGKNSNNRPSTSSDSTNGDRTSIDSSNSMPGRKNDSFKNSDNNTTTSSSSSSSSTSDSLTYSIIGVVTKSDLLRGYCSGKQYPGKQEIGELAKSKLYLCPETATKDELAGYFLDYKIHHMLVHNEKNKKIIGLVSTFDLSKAIILENEKDGGLGKEKKSDILKRFFLKFSLKKEHGHCLKKMGSNVVSTVQEWLPFNSTYYPNQCKIESSVVVEDITQTKEDEIHQ